MEISSATNIYNINSQNNNIKNTNNDKNYLTMKLDDIKELSFNEVKSNLTDIKKNLDNKLSNSDNDLELFAINAKILTIENTNNSQYNQAMFNTLDNIDDSFSALAFQSEIQNNLIDYSNNNNDIEASFVMDNKFNTNNNKINISNIDMDNFISKMLTTFNEDLQEAKGGKLKEQYQNIVDGYSLLQQNYNQAKSEPIYA